ncbi:MAG: ABC transporter ATP-binding protein [Thermoplasmata archaeon]|nr:ABC transporter ATP-binding protein [Thermoplasmata archaeon]
MSSSEPLLRVEGVSAAWGAQPVLDRVSFEVGTGELLVLLGPNGSGKSTLLRCLAGLERPSGGRIVLDGRDVTEVPAHRRKIVLMFQDAALFPHRTVFENIAYAPLLQRRPRPEVDEEVRRQVDLLGLAGLEDRSPDQLSGGERQRVALARTLAARPHVVLLDEPLASIDPELKAELRAVFRRTLRAAGATAIHVTHDRSEGLFLGDRVGLLFGGRLERLAPPGPLFSDPGSERAARFLGYNILVRGAGPEAVDPRHLRLSDDPIAGPALTVLASGTTGGERLIVLRDSAGERIESRGSDEGPAPVAGTVLYGRWDRSIPLRSVSSGAPKDAKNRGAPTPS